MIINENPTRTYHYNLINNNALPTANWNCGFLKRKLSPFNSLLLRFQDLLRVVIQFRVLSVTNSF